MSKINRRTFLKGTSLVSTSLLMPNFLNALPSISSSDSDKNVVIIQLSGGNDGLNTIVPYRNDLYYKNRPGIGLKDNDLIRNHDELAFNKNLSDIARLYDNGNLTVINNVGYPNPNRSHFRSMDIWQTASDADQYLTTGWIGRFLDSQCAHHPRPEINALEINEVLSPALKGRNIKGMAMRRPQMLFRATQHPFFKSMANHKHEHHGADYLYKTFANTTNSAEYVFRKTKTYKATGNYPKTRLGSELATVAQLINSRVGTKVYYVSLTGFDTHANQKGAQGRLLKQYSTAVDSFIKDLKANGSFKDTLIMTFSEFGRRVKENGSNGTDHGAANNIFIMGENLKNAGFYNEAPDLANLDDGDLKHRIDFRQVYSTLIENWLQLDAKESLGGSYKNLSFI